jgi:formamidase
VALAAAMTGRGGAFGVAATRVTSGDRYHVRRMTRLYYAAACQTSFECPATRDGIAERVKRMCAMAENTIGGYEPFFDVRLLVFPEFAHAAPIYDTVDKLRERLAVELPNEHTDRYAALCKKHGCYIQTGSFIELDRAFPDVVFNATVLIGPNGVLTKYRKVNPWIPWEVHASPHDFPASQYSDEPFPVAKTEIGNLGVAICYDWLFPETIRQIAFNGAEVIIRVSAYMDPWGATPPMDWWTLFNRARAVENTTYVVAANQGATFKQYPPFSWPGGSMVVDYDGRILAQADAGEGEKVVVAPIDIQRLRDERARRAGHDMRAHLRTEIYPYMRQCVFPSAIKGDHPLTDKGIRQRITSAKNRVSAGLR